MLSKRAREFVAGALPPLAIAVPLPQNGEKATDMGRNGTEEKSRRARSLYLLELALATAGVMLAAVYIGAWLDGYLESHLAIQRFEKTAVNAGTVKTTPAPGMAGTKSETGTVAKSAGDSAAAGGFAAYAHKVDFSLWSSERVQAYRASLPSDDTTPIALLQIPKIHLRAPVFNDDGVLSLNRGVGRIAGTAMPGTGGNTGLAGHRDGFFRGLKDVKRGDRLELVTREGILTYVVDGIEIVSPNDVSVLGRREKPSLTLVTCYPFYYLGHAPKRYVVEASLRNVSGRKTGVPAGGLSPKQPDGPATRSPQNAVQGERKP